MPVHTITVVSSSPTGPVCILPWSAGWLRGWDCKLCQLWWHKLSVDSHCTSVMLFAHTFFLLYCHYYVLCFPIKHIRKWPRIYSQLMDFTILLHIHFACCSVIITSFVFALNIKNCPRMAKSRILLYSSRTYEVSVVVYVSLLHSITMAHCCVRIVSDCKLYVVNRKWFWSWQTASHSLFKNLCCVVCLQ